MGPKTKKLIITMIETIDLLDRYGATNWSAWLKKDIVLIEKSDFYGIEHLLSAFGGMGSFNDLYFCKENGYSICDDEVKSVNDRFLKLKSTLYDLAVNIHKEVNTD